MISTVLSKEMFGLLPERERSIVNLYFYYGYKEREIAGMLGISRPRISQVKSRAIERMREYVKK